MEEDAVPEMCRSVTERVREVSSGLISMMNAPCSLEIGGMSHAGVTCAEVPITSSTPQVRASSSACSCAIHGIDSPKNTMSGLRIAPQPHRGGITSAIFRQEGYRFQQST